MLNSLELTLTLNTAEGRTGKHQHGGGESTGRSRKRRRRVLFRALICADWGPGPPLTTRDAAVLCGVCLLTARDPSSSGAEAATSARGGGGVDAYKSERSLLSFAGYELSHNLHHVDVEMAEDMEGLI